MKISRTNSDLWAHSLFFPPFNLSYTHNSNGPNYLAEFCKDRMRDAKVLDKINRPIHI